jgi:6-pyruvoyl-tetrahydropterin synthase
VGLTISKTVYIEVAHRMIGHPIPANDRIHGHSLKVTVTAARDELHTPLIAGMVMDFSAFDQQVAIITGLLDHQYLNELLQHPTLECVAEFIGTRMALVAPLHCIAVKVERTSLGQAVEWTPP